MDMTIVVLLLLDFILVGVVLVLLLCFRIEWKRMKRLYSERITYFEYFRVVLKWIDAKQNGLSIAEYLRQDECKTIAIYGMGDLGKRLLKELAGTDICVCYGIDKNAKRIMTDIRMITTEENWEAVDAVVVTAFRQYKSIEQIVREKMEDIKVYSIEDILYSIGG